MRKIDLRGIHYAELAYMVGWVKRNAITTYVGFAYLIAPQKYEIATKLANPTRLVADLRLNPTYDLSFRPTKWIHFIMFLSCNIVKFAYGYLNRLRKKPRSQHARLLLPDAMRIF